MTLLFTILFTGSVFVGCEHSKDSVSPNNNQYEALGYILEKPTTPDYILLGELHNSGLEALMPIVDSTWSQDSIYNLSIDYVDTAGIAYGFGAVDTAIITTIKNTMKTISKDSTGLMAYLSMTGNSKLIPEMSTIVGYLMVGNVEVIKGFETKILNSNSYTQIEKDILLTACVVGRYSYDYGANRWGEIDLWWVPGAIADAIGGVTGGFAGAQPGDFNWNAAGWCALGASIAIYI